MSCEHSRIKKQLVYDNPECSGKPWAVIDTCEDCGHVVYNGLKTICENLPPGKSGIPEKFAKATMRQLIAYDEAQRQVLHKCWSYIENIKNGYDNLILLGREGTGKTHIACSVMNALNKEGIGSIYTTLYRFFIDFRSAMNIGHELSSQIIFEKYSKIPLLILDEIGTKPTLSDYECEILTAVVDERYNSEKSTIYISNLRFEPFSSYLGTRIIDRLAEHSTICVLNWESFRKKKETFPVKKNFGEVK